MTEPTNYKDFSIEPLTNSTIGSMTKESFGVYQGHQQTTLRIFATVEDARKWMDEEIKENSCRAE